MASENADREKVYDLFERAVKDYICKLQTHPKSTLRYCELFLLNFFFLEGRE